MATAEQLKAMLRSYVEGDGERFLTVSMQIAAHAARKGQDKLARELRELVDEAKERAAAPPASPAVPIARLPDDPRRPSLARRGPPPAGPAAPPRGGGHGRLEKRARQRATPPAPPPPPRRKLLLVGPPGSGKTMTAAALAGELHLPLLSVRLDG